jgi:sulfur-oxidizing protein SoxY
MQTRRTHLRHAATVTSLLAGTGLFPRFAQAAFNQTAFEAKTMAAALKALGHEMPIESKEVKLTAPDIAENGAVVPMGASCSLPNLRQLMLLIEKNPSTLVAIFNITDDIDPSISTRSKMAQTSDVYAVAVTADGKTWFAKKEVKVTLGGCGG